MATGEQILIVESDPDIADLIGRQSLQPLGYQVTVVGDAGSAIKFAIQNSPSLILANLNFPGLSGKDMLAAFNAQGVKSPVIVIAEKGQETDAIQAFRLGATDVIFWPLKDAEVVSIVERALRQTEEARERQKLDRQLKVMNEELQRKLSDLTTILSTSKAVVSVTDQRVLFDMILEAALKLADANMCWLLLREERSKAFLMRAQRNLPDAWAKRMNQQGLRIAADLLIHLPHDEQQSDHFGLNLDGNHGNGLAQGRHLQLLQRHTAHHQALARKRDE